MKTIFTRLVKARKGNVLDMVIEFAIIGIVIVLIPGLLAQVTTTVPGVGNTSPLYNASIIAQTSLGSGMNLVSLTPVFFGIVILLTVLLYLRKKE
jgi:hypothetical protein